MKTKLTKQEIGFINDLINDEIENKEDNILNSFFYGCVMTNNEVIKDCIDFLFKDIKSNFFNDSIVFLMGEKTSMVGKYGDYFWFTNEINAFEIDDEKIEYISKSIHNVILFMIYKTWFLYLDEKGSDNELEYALSTQNKNLMVYIERYKKICHNNGYVLDLSWKVPKYNKLKNILLKY